MIKNLQCGEYSPKREERWKDVIDLIIKVAGNESKKPIEVLDLGCGDGALFTFVKRKAEETGLDVSKIRYTGVDTFGSYRSTVERLGGVFIKKDFFKLKDILKTESFDVVIASDIIEHIVDTDGLVDIVRRVLKPSGYFYITTPNLASWHSRLSILFGYQPLASEVSNVRSDFGKGFLGRIYSGGDDKAIHHLRIFTLRALVEFLVYHGFRINKIIGGGYRKFDSLFFGYFKSLSPVIKVICQKT